jgi:hypothetical protein
MRGGGAGVIEEGAGVGPFLEPQKAREEQHNRARNLPDAIIVRRYIG